ncbi:hypothetical protein HGM15179_004731 [Zosterops borbonicus]|uniref:Claudin 12 n=5 Tax=Passeriformes TaxID=9126 RepID=A0A8K1GQW8_9PASS|nr:hypothetical protein HGM15179_004731 [Zosterops borbonicus]
MAPPQRGGKVKASSLWKSKGIELELEENKIRCYYDLLLKFIYYCSIFLQVDCFDLTKARVKHHIKIILMEILLWSPYPGAILKQLLWANMGCRDVHAATVLAFLSGTASVAGLLAAVLLPNWRQMRLYTYNKNERNVTVYTGLWIKCARFDGSRDCVIYDPQWYTAVDQLDLRVLQFALPLSMFTAVSALFLCMIGMCNTAFVSSVPNVKLAKCLVNSAGCHLVAGLLFLLACAICLTPSIWVIFYNNYLNRKYEPVFSFDISVFIAIASAGGLFFTSILLFLWYCACKSLPSPFWQPLYSHAPSMHSYASQPYSARSRLSAVEIDIPVVSHSS